MKLMMKLKKIVKMKMKHHFLYRQLVLLQIIYTTFVNMLA